MYWLCTYRLRGKKHNVNVNDIHSNKYIEYLFAIFLRQQSNIQLFHDVWLLKSNEDGIMKVADINIAGDWVNATKKKQ